MAAQPVTNNTKVSPIKSYADLKEIRESFKAKGGKFVGTYVWLSVRMGDDTIPLKDIRNMILNHPKLPDEWAPEQINDLTAYLQTATSLNRGSSLKNFQYDPDLIPFTPNCHGGYSVHRMWLRKEADIPTAHKVLHLEKRYKVIRDDDGNITSRDVEDVEADSGIRIMLKRVSGDRDTDATGESEWSLNVQFDIDRTDFDSDEEFREAKLEKQARYLPFIQTLNDEFERKRNEVYDSTQVRQVIFDDIIVNRMDSISMPGRGVYFIPDWHTEEVETLRDELLKIHRGIQLLTINEAKWDDETMNSGFNSLSRGVSDALIDEAEDLLVELQEFRDGETKTRPSTWFRRRDALKELKGRVDKFKKQLMLDTDILDDILEDASIVLDEQVAEIEK